MSKLFTRRDFLRATSMIGAGAAVAACAPQPPAAQNPQTSEGEKPYAGSNITFWSMNYGDTVEWQDMLNKFGASFKEETGIDVTVEIINWSVAFNTWLTVAQGGAHPDCSDMYWLHSFAAIGGGQHGPLPLTSYLPKYWPNLNERFYEPSLVDVYFKGDFYGIPWRGDIRPMIVRTEFLEEAGFDKAPDNWDEVIEMGKALTVRAPNGDVTRWGYTLGTATPVQQLMSYYWSAGGEFMSSDGKTATLDNDAMRKTLQFMYDLIWTHEIMSPDFMEKSWTPMDMFIAGQIAMIGSISDSVGNDLERDYPDLNGKWAYALPPAGPDNRAAYAGAGYWGVLRGTDKVDQCVEWIAYLSRDENMKTMTEYIARVSPNKKVMETPYWTEREWRKVINETLNYGHTSQHTNPAWSAIASTEPGGIIYDLFYDSVVKKQNMDDVIARAQQRMQEEMDKSDI
jgi:multiple sugar transport system substrate-binding protein